MINIDLLPKKGGIYKITSPSGKIYIGKTKNLFQRFGKYKSLHCVKQNKLYNSFLKYGFGNHVVEIIELSNDLQNLNEKEIFYIKEYKSYNTSHGLNLTEGGDGVRKKHSIETKKKISDSLLKSESFKKVMSSPEYREKLSNSLKGHEGYNKGISRPEKDIIKIKEGVRKRLELYGPRKHTESSKKKMSENRAGELNSNSKKYKILYNDEVIEFNCRKYIKTFLNNLNDKLNLPYNKRYSYDGLFKNGFTKEIKLLPSSLVMVGE
jgi:group I intron endonuclease